MSLRRHLAPYTQFQIVIRLQQVRKLVCDWPDRFGQAPEKNPVQELIATIQGIATVARHAGVFGFASVCLQVCERILPLVEHRDLPTRVRWLLQEWSAHSEMYIRHPDRAELAAAMVDEFNDSRWGLEVEQGARARLLHELLEPFV